jgi:hypothetical protein
MSLPFYRPHAFHSAVMGMACGYRRSASLDIRLALNTFQRSTGLGDIYPSVSPPAVVETLDCISRLIKAARASQFGKLEVDEMTTKVYQWFIDLLLAELWLPRD